MSTTAESPVGDLPLRREPTPPPREPNALERATADQASWEYEEWAQRRRFDLSDTWESTRSGARINIVEAPHDPRDPPGVVRYVIVQPDGSTHPKNARLYASQRPPAPPDDDLDRPFPRGRLNGGPS